MGRAEITASHIIYYHLCHRKLWLYHKGIRQEYTNQEVAKGKLIEKNAYKRRSRRWAEIQLGNLKIDYFDRVNNVVREIKKSPRLEFLHIAQVQYYMYILEQKGLQGVTGTIEYPEQRKILEVQLNDETRLAIPKWEREIKEIVCLEICPDLVQKPYCSSCAYHDFCYI